MLYRGLMRHEPTPVVALNLAVALAEAEGAPVGLAILNPLSADLADYQPFHATRAELLGRVGQTEAALAAYDQAIALAASSADARFLGQRRARLLNS